MAGFMLGERRVDLAGLCVHHSGSTQALTPTEAALIERLLAAQGAPVDRGLLLVEVWGYRATTRSRTVDTTVHRLRQKLEQDPHAPAFLLTVRGEGICLVGAKAIEPSGLEDVQPLVGRQRDLERIDVLLRTSRVVRVEGPVGVGKTALMAAVARRWDGPVFVGQGDAQTSPSGWFELITGRPGSTLADACEHLGADTLLVLDGADTLGRDVLQSLSDVAHLLLTSTSSSFVGPVHQLQALALDRAVELLCSQVQNHGQVLDREDGIRIMEPRDCLPAEVLLIAPLVALFGVPGVQGACTVLHPVLRRRVELLHDKTRGLLGALVVFEGSFDLPVALAVLGADAATVMVGIRTLLAHGFIIGLPDGRFRLLRAVRTLLQNHVPERAQQGALAFCVRLAQEALVHGSSLQHLHGADILQASERVERLEDAEQLALSLLDLLFSGTRWRTEILNALLGFRDRFESDAILCRSVNAESFSCVPVSEMHIEALQLRADAGSFEAAATRARCSDLIKQPQLQQAWLDKAMAASGPPDVEARYLPTIAGRYPPEIYRQRVMSVRAAALRHGWTACLQDLRNTEMATFVVNDRLTDARALLIGQRSMEVGPTLASAVVEIFEGDPSTAQALLQGLMERGLYLHLVSLLRTMLQLHRGEPPTALSDAWSDLLNPRNRAIAVALAGWPDRRSSNNNAVDHVLQTGRIDPEHAPTILLVALARLVRAHQGLAVSE